MTMLCSYALLKKKMHHNFNDGFIPPFIVYMMIKISRKNGLLEMMIFKNFIKSVTIMVIPS